VMETVIDKKAIGVYLGITYGVTWLLAIVLSVSGGFSSEASLVRQIALLIGLMLLPAAAALAAATLTRDKTHPRIVLWPMAPRPVLFFAVLGPAAFVLIYGLSAAFGFATVDWGVTALQSQMPDPGDVGLQQQLPALFLMIAGFLLSIVLGPTLFALVSLGNEIGWRAYLAQKLAPLGRWRAAAISGMLWGLGWYPLLLFGAWAGEDTFFEALTFSIRAVAGAILFGMILAEVFRRTQHVGLTSVLAGCFFAQEAGIWPYLIPRHHPMVAGPLGFIGMGVFAALVLAVFLIPRWERLLGVARPAEPDESSSS